MYLGFYSVNFKEWILVRHLLVEYSSFLWVLGPINPHKSQNFEVLVQIQTILVWYQNQECFYRNLVYCPIFRILHYVFKIEPSKITCLNYPFDSETCILVKTELVLKTRFLTKVLKLVSHHTKFESYRSWDLDFWRKHKTNF